MHAGLSIRTPLADGSSFLRAAAAVNQNAGNLLQLRKKLFDWRDVACFVECSHDRRRGEGRVTGAPPLLWSCDGGIRGSIAAGRFHCHRWSDSSSSTLPPQKKKKRAKELAQRN